MGDSTTVLLDTDDLGEAEAVLSANYTKQRYSTSPTAMTRTRVLRSQVGSMVSDHFEFDYDLDYEGDPIAAIVLCRFHSGFVHQRLPNGNVETCGPNEVTAVGIHDGVRIKGQVSNAYYDTVFVDRRHLTHVAARGPETDEAEPVHLTSTTAISPDANILLTTAVDYVRRTMHNNPDVIEQPLGASTIGRYLAATMLTALPNTALLERTDEDRHDSTPLTLRRAEAFIDDHAHTDISLTDIARAVHVTPRTLQYTFRKYRDCTPMAYVRRVRLHHAHLDLVAGDRMTTTVGYIAAKWGFVNIGRFAVYYRERYGQSPHVTLRD
jgi:AraC-like DNA-binding protein